jgi:hypothetical protein
MSEKWQALAVIGAFMFFAIASTDEEVSAPASGDRIPLNTAGSAGGVEVKISKVKTRQSVGDPNFLGATASEGGTYVVIHYSVKNVSRKPLGMFSQPSVELVSNDGVVYEADIDGSASYASSSDFDEKIVSDLNPGITVDGAEVFEVSKELFNVATWSARVVTDDGNLWFNLR